MALKLETYFQKCGLDRRENAQQSVHLTLGILRQSQAVFHAFSFFWLDGFAVPAPAQVTQTVRRLLAKLILRREINGTNFKSFR